MPCNLREPRQSPRKQARTDKSRTCSSRSSVSGRLRNFGTTGGSFLGGGAGDICERAASASLALKLLGSVGGALGTVLAGAIGLLAVESGRRSVGFAESLSVSVLTASGFMACSRLPPLGAEAWTRGCSVCGVGLELEIGIWPVKLSCCPASTRGANVPGGSGDGALVGCLTRGDRGWLEDIGTDVGGLALGGRLIFTGGDGLREGDLETDRILTSLMDGLFALPDEAPSEGRPRPSIEGGFGLCPSMLHSPELRRDPACLLRLITSLRLDSGETGRPSIDLPGSGVLALWNEPDDCWR